MRQQWFWTAQQHLSSKPVLASSQAVLWAEAFAQTSCMLQSPAPTPGQGSSSSNRLLAALHSAQYSCLSLGKGSSDSPDQRLPSRQVPFVAHALGKRHALVQISNKVPNCQPPLAVA